MKYWQMTFAADDEEYVTEHGSLESAERDACHHVLEHGIGNLVADEQEEDVKNAVLKIVQSIELEGYAQALATYRDLLKAEGWDETVTVEEKVLLTEADVPLLQKAAEVREEWTTVETDESAA